MPDEPEAFGEIFRLAAEIHISSSAFPIKRKIYPGSGVKGASTWLAPELVSIQPYGSPGKKFFLDYLCTKDGEE